MDDSNDRAFFSLWAPIMIRIRRVASGSLLTIARYDAPVHLMSSLDHQKRSTMIPCSYQIDVVDRQIARSSICCSLDERLDRLCHSLRDRQDRGDVR